MAAENSEVSRFDSRTAVAVMTSLSAGARSSKVKTAVPVPSTVTMRAPRDWRPSPCPLGSAAALAKNSTVYSPGIAFSDPSTTDSVSYRRAAVSTGKFCRPCAPVSVSPGSFGVTPSPGPGELSMSVWSVAVRSMPSSVTSSPLSKIEFSTKRLPDTGGRTQMPAPAFSVMTLRRMTLSCASACT